MNRVSLLSDTNLRLYRSISNKNSNLLNKISSIFFRIKRWFIPPNRDELIGRAALLDQRSEEKDSRDKASFIARALKLANKNVPFMHSLTELDHLKAGEARVLAMGNEFGYIKKGDADFSIKIIHHKSGSDSNYTIHFVSDYTNISLEQLKKLIAREEIAGLKPQNSQEKITRSKVKQAWKLVKEMVEPKQDPLKLKLILSDLATLYNEVKHKTLTDHDSFKALNSLLRAASREMLEAFEKGKITREERDALMPQLIIVEEALERPQKDESVPFAAVSPDSMRKLFNKPIKPGPVPAEWKEDESHDPKIEKPAEAIEWGKPIDSEEALLKMLEGPFNVDKIMSIDFEVVRGEVWPEFTRNRASLVRNLYAAPAPVLNNNHFLFKISEEGKSKIKEKIEELIKSYKNLEKSDHPDYLLALGKLFGILQIFENNKSAEFLGLRKILRCFNEKPYRGDNLNSIRESVHINPLFAKNLNQLKVYEFFLSTSLETTYRLHDDLPQFIIDEKEKKSMDNALKYIRPLTNPLLQALFTKYSFIDRFEDIQEKIDDRITFGMMSEEAIMDNPEGVAEFMLNRLNQTLIEEGKAPYSYISPLAREDLQALFFMSRATFGQLQIVDYIDKRPHLLDDQEILNFISNLFFQESLKETLDNNAEFRNTLPGWLENKIIQYENDLDKQLFFIEMHMKLKVYYAQMEYEGSFKEVDLNALPKNKSLNHLYALNLYKKLQQERLLPDEVKEVVDQYNYLISHPLNRLKRDPIRDDFIKRKMDALLDHLGIVERKPEWPPELLELPQLSDVLADESFSLDTAFIEGRKVFKIRSKGNYIQVEIVNGEPRVYKKIEGFDELLEHIDGEKYRDRVSLDLREIIQKEIEALIKPPYASLDKFKRLFTLLRGEVNALRPERFAIALDRLYFKPSDPDTLYSLNDKGAVQFIFDLFKGHIHSVTDKRDDSGPWQLVSGIKIDHPKIEKLSLVEDRAFILGFAKGIKLERIELPRFNLQFNVRDSELYGTGEYEGYRLDFSENPLLPLSIRLVSDDETKPIKVIIPRSKHLLSRERALTHAKFSLIAAIYDVFQKIYNLIQSPNVTPRMLFSDFGLDSSTQIESYTLNINPVTKEFNRGLNPLPLIDALNQAVKVQDIPLAYQIYKGLNLTDKDLNKKTIKGLRFIFEESPSLEMKEFKRVVAAHLKSILVKSKKFEELVKKIDEQIKPETAEEFKKRKRYQEFVPIPECVDKVEVPPPYVPKPSTFNIEAAEPLLFPSNVTDHYFKITEDAPDPVSLPKAESDAPLCEKEAVTQFNAYLKEHAPKKIKVELKHKDLLLSRLIDPKITWLEKEEENTLKSLHEIIYRSEDKEEELAILSGRKMIASETDLMLALLQKDLKALAPFLPKDCDLNKLKAALILYYDAKIKLHHLKVLKQAIHDGIEPKLIHEILNRGRKYDPFTHPELLIFETMSFMTFRKLAAKDQLELLNQVMKESTALVLAPTGSGKTKLISVIRALMRPNGSNLVTQKVLPTLYKQTLQQMEELLGEVFRKRVFPFRYDPKFKPAITLNEKTYSAFTVLYNDLLTVIRDKGILITDYKTLPLLEEKFFSLSYELNNLRKANIDLPALEVEHWNSLRKILLLLKHNEDQMMDEFDEPNRPVHRIQMAIAGMVGEEPASFMLEESIRLYDRLMEEKGLYLKENLQADIPDDERERIIKKIAKEYAQGDKKLERYFLGESEEALSELDKAPADIRDKAAFLKDQFTVFLPLCLSNSHLSRYKRASNGLRLLPCELGTPHDAKFGNIIEEINYLNQEYRQAGVHPGEILAWLANIKKDPSTFEKVFRGVNIETPIDQLVDMANADMAIRGYFLERALKRLKVNGAVVSMNPHNAISMAKVVSGVSATMGDPDALSSTFSYDSDEIGSVQAEMAYRFMDRVKGNESLLEYDPADPLKLLVDCPRIDALIDGAGAFKEVKPNQVGRIFSSAYHDEKGDIIDPDKEKFYFAQAYTRGTDRKFKPGSTALLTVNSKGTLEQLNQQEGRMRLEGQKIRIARSKYNPEIKSVRDVLQMKVRFQARKRAKDLFDSKKLEADNVIRTELKMKLLPIENIDAYLDQFDGVQKEFITEPATNYKVPGSYYDKHKHLTLIDSDPIKELEKHRDNKIKRAKELKLDAASEKLTQLSYPEDLRKKLMDKVASSAPETEIEVELEEELEMEQEQEQEQELEMEQEQEQEQELELDTQKLRNEDRLYVGRKVAIGVSAYDIHPAFDYRIGLEGKFQPQPNAYPGARKIFSSSMFRVNCIHVKKHSSLGTYWIQIADRIDFAYVGGEYLTKEGFIYDLDRDQVLESYQQDTWRQDIDNDDFNNLFMQVKFLDGRIEGYRDRELLMLKRWLEKNKPKEMLNFFLNTILRNREVDKDRFPSSQLGKLFDSIIK